eukprot:scaffold392692_cov20-Prasinocladus_malaysianus.AAC.1
MELWSFCTQVPRSCFLVSSSQEAKFEVVLHILWHRADAVIIPIQCNMSQSLVNIPLNAEVKGLVCPLSGDDLAVGVGSE